MPDTNNIKNSSQWREDGYTPKGYVTKEIEGRIVKVPVAELKIIPPKSGTAAVTPKKQ